MTITVDVSPELEAQIQEKAAKAGLDLDAYVRQVIESEAAPVPDAENHALILLLQRWRAEDEAMTPAEAEEAEADWQELTFNLNVNRA